MKAILAICMILCSYSAAAQKNEYKYKREISGVNNTWHRIILPDDIFEKIKRDLSDIRIYSISGRDTAEAPYILKQVAATDSIKEHPFKLINQSKNADGYYFTLALTEQSEINEILLDFRRTNYDWKVKLEGSPDLANWFTIADDYRIVSIKNEHTDFSFSKLVFPSSQYRYFRISVKSDLDPMLNSARISLTKRVENATKRYAVSPLKVTEQGNTGVTFIEMKLKHPVPVSSVRIFVKDTIDFYRDVNIEFPFDSVKTEKGWWYNYRTLSSGTLNSLDNNEFNFSSTIVNRIRIGVINKDSKPIQIDSVIVKGPVHELIARFTDKGKHYLVYGNDQVTAPEYDISYFQDKIPTDMAALQLGAEVKIGITASSREPLFKNKIWLWVVIVVIAGLLGLFSTRMMAKR